MAARAKKAAEAANASLRFMEGLPVRAVRTSDGRFALPVEHFPEWEDQQGNALTWMCTKERTPQLAATALEAALPVRKLDTAAIARGAPDGAMQVTWLGHASVLVQFNGWSVLADPIFSHRCSPVQWAGPARVRPSPVSITDIAADLPVCIDAVCISHNHYDHLDLQSVKALNGLERPPVWFVPLGTKAWMKEAGVDSVVEMEWGQQATFKDDHDLTAGGGNKEIDGAVEGRNRPDLLVTCLPCQHWCARGILDRNRMLWAAWAFSTANATTPPATYFFGGDTGYCGGVFRQIGSTLGQVDVAALPIGAYGGPSEEWFHKANHMNPEDAVAARADLDARHAVAMHWGTFQLTAEPLLEPAQRLAAAREKAGLAEAQFAVLAHGETRCFPLRPQT